MKNVLALRGNIALIALFTLFLSASAFSQAKLRIAMDTDADNKADFTVFRPSNNVWYIAKSGGGFTFTQFGLASEDIMAPGDFDGDGKGDISVWRDATGAWYRFNSSNGTFVATSWGSSGDEPVGRDYDGDGKTDLAVVRRTGGTMIWYVLSSLNGSFQAAPFGLSTDYSAPGDYDGDGKFDLAVQRPGATLASQSTFYVQRSTAGLLVTNWGLGNDLVVPGDYDGDGKTDVAVVREGTTATSSLVWYIQKSTDGGLIAVSFGTTGTDLNTQNDYDGDGKTDISIWRNTTGQFWILRSTDGVIQATSWGSSDDYPVASYDTH